MIEQDVMTGTRFVVAVIFIVIALVLAVVNRGKVKSVVYNRSRQFIVLGNLLIAIHMFVQFLGHFRETSLSLCWAINIAFFVLLMPLYYMASVNILCAGHNLKKRFWRMGLFYLVCYIILGAGYLTGHLINDQQPWMTVTAIAAFLLFLFNSEQTYNVNRDIHRAYSALTDDELEERHIALRYLARSIRAVLAFSLFLPWWSMIPSLPVVSVLTLCLFFSLLWYEVEFYFYGRDQLQVLEVNDEIYEANMVASPGQRTPSKTTGHNSSSRLDDSEEASRIEHWIVARGFTDPNITIDLALEQIGVPLAALNLYLEKHTGAENFRKWITSLRVEEAKRLMREHPDYTLQAVAEACGYANNPSLTRAFKSVVGVPPKDWAAKK